MNRGPRGAKKNNRTVAKHPIQGILPAVVSEPILRKEARTMSEDISARRKQALDRALQQIEKSFGKGAIMQLDMATCMVHSGISTGSLSLDLALGGFGIPHGRVVEFFGPE